jgi:hypothetical protein
MKATLLFLALTIGGLVAIAQDSSTSRVPVTLVSDGETWVSISGLMVPAKFRTRTVPLALGEYEVIGRKKGYWDVRQTFTVVPGRPLSVISVVCTLTIDYWPDGTPKK